MPFRACHARARPLGGGCRAELCYSGGGVGYVFALHVWTENLIVHYSREEQPGAMPMGCVQQSLEEFDPRLYSTSKSRAIDHVKYQARTVPGANIARDRGRRPWDRCVPVRPTCYTSHRVQGP